MGGRKWAEADKKILEERYFNMPKYEIAKLLNRSYKSILNYAWSHHLSSYQKQYNIGIKQARQIDLSPTFNLGCLCGLILGDGYISKTKHRNYRINVKTTKADFAQYFTKILEEACPNLMVHRQVGIHTRKFPNGTIKTDTMYLVETNSKILYEVIRPFKQRDYFWQIPKFLTTLESKMGFIRGIFDAEGCVSTNRLNKKGIYYLHITVASKHKDNLVPIQELLFSLGISTHLYARNNAYISTLQIHKREDLIKFQRIINFGYLAKKERLEELLWQQKPCLNVQSAVIRQV